MSIFKRRSQQMPTSRVPSVARVPSVPSVPAVTIDADELSKLRQESIDAQMALIIREGELRTRDQIRTLDRQLTDANIRVRWAERGEQVNRDELHRNIREELAKNLPADLVRENAQLRRNAVDFADQLARAEGRAAR